MCEVNDTSDGLVLLPLKYSYWKPVYERIENDYMTDFEAMLVYRKDRN